MSQDLEKLLKECEERLNAATENDIKAAVVMGAPLPLEALNVQIAIRKAAYPLVINAPDDIRKLTEIVRVLQDSIEQGFFLVHDTTKCEKADYDAAAEYMRNANIRVEQIARGGE